MTRTRIIAADGTSFRPDTATRRLIRRSIIIFLIGAGLIFTSAAVIGLTRAALHPSPKPIIHTANDTASFNDGWNTALDDILNISNSAGGNAKLNSCLAHSANADALHTCIDR
jgi:hypothetical protein